MPTPAMHHNAIQLPVSAPSNDGPSQDVYESNVRLIPTSDQEMIDKKHLRMYTRHFPSICFVRRIDNNILRVPTTCRLVRVATLSSDLRPAIEAIPAEFRFTSGAFAQISHAVDRSAPSIDYSHLIW